MLLALGASVGSIELDVCLTHAVHARTTITFGGVASSIPIGNIGVSPGTSITGAYTLGEGNVLADTSEFAATVLAMTEKMQAFEPTDYSYFDATPMDIEIGGQTFTPGLYRSESAINFAYGTVVTLDGSDGLTKAGKDFIFQAGTTLVTAANTKFIFKNGVSTPFSNATTPV